MNRIALILFLIVCSCRAQVVLSGHTVIYGGTSMTNYPSATNNNSFYLTASQYAAQRLGFMISWGMPTFWPGQPGEIAPANTNIDSFSPNGTPKVDQWLNVAQTAGAKFVVLVAKHEDGFAVWPSTYHFGTNVPYSVASTRWYSTNGNYDLVKQFCNGCRARNINPVLYYGIQNLTFEAQSGETMQTGFSDYTNMIGWQISELLTNYGNITAIWTDSWGWQVGFGVQSYTYFKSPMMRAFISSHQPSCLQIENAHQHPTTNSMVEVYELGTTGNGGVQAGNIIPAEQNDTMDYYAGQLWFFDPSKKHCSAVYYPPRYIAQTIQFLSTNSAEYDLDMMPDTNGAIDAGQITNFSAIVDCLNWSNNLALGKPTTASSTNTSDFNSTNSAVLTDGYFGQLGNGHGGQTFTNLFETAGNETTPYVEIDLGSAKLVSRVEVFGRCDTGDSGVVRDIFITLYDNAHTLVYTGPILNAGNAWIDMSFFNGPAQLTQMTGGVSARYVRASRQNAGSGGDSILALTEVQVF